jgi:hypothetical protein
MALRQESKIPDRRDLRMSTEEGCDLAADLTLSAAGAVVVSAAVDARHDTAW